MGYTGRQKNVWRIAKQAHLKAGLHAYVGRKLKKRQYRGLWTQRINAAARAAGSSYSQLIAGMKRADIQLNRKSLSELAVRDAASFQAVLQHATQSKQTSAS